MSYQENEKGGRQGERRGGREREGRKGKWEERESERGVGKGRSGEEGRRDRLRIKKAMYTNLLGLVLDCIYIEERLHGSLDST